MSPELNKTIETGSGVPAVPALMMIVSLSSGAPVTEVIVATTLYESLAFGLNPGKMPANENASLFCIMVDVPPFTANVPVVFGPAPAQYELSGMSVGLNVHGLVTEAGWLKSVIMNPKT